MSEVVGVIEMGWDGMGWAALRYPPSTLTARGEVVFVVNHAVAHIHVGYVHLERPKGVVMGKEASGSMRHSLFNQSPRKGD